MTTTQDDDDGIPVFIEELSDPMDAIEEPTTEPRGYGVIRTMQLLDGVERCDSEGVWPWWTAAALLVTVVVTLKFLRQEQR